MEIDGKAPEHNLREMRKGSASGSAACAVIKSNAYGHGVAQMPTLLQSAAIGGGPFVDRLEQGDCPEHLRHAVPGAGGPSQHQGRHGNKPAGDPPGGCPRLHHFTMLRTGIGLYGLRPSRETFISVREKRVPWSSARSSRASALCSRAGWCDRPSESRGTVRPEQVPVEGLRALRTDSVAHQGSRLLRNVSDNLDHLFAFRADADEPLSFLHFLHDPLPLTRAGSRPDP